MIPDPFRAGDYAGNSPVRREPCGMKSPLTAFTGLIAAPYTPFHSDGSLNLDTIERQAERLIAEGVSGAFVCGTTGEGLSLTLDERKQVAARWRTVAGDRLRIIVHVGHLCQADSRELARHAQSIGADGVATIAPCFFRPASIDALVEWCAGVAAAAPKTPFLYYHIPTWTGVTFPVAETLPHLAERIPNFAGIKFTHNDIADYAATVKVANGRFVLFFGADEVLLDAVRVGCVAAVGSTYNYGAPIYRRVFGATADNRPADAEAAQHQATDFIGAMLRYGGLPANKTIMRLSGIDCGPVRPPLTPLTDTQAESLRTELEAVGFFAAIGRG